MSSRRKCEMWISNNRVLLGNSRKVHGRNPNFEPEETKLLISLWGDPKVQKTLITTHKKHPVIVKLAEKMREYGYVRSPEEINTRIKNLKCFYNRLKKDMEMGILTEPTWKHFNAMEEIMSRPIFSVRPDEVPKPSARYKMEEEINNAMENGEGMKMDDDEGEEIQFKKEPTSDDELTGDKNEVTQEVQVEETSLIEPKQEPIDLDDDDDNNYNGKREEDIEMNSSFPQISSSSSPKPSNRLVMSMAGSRSNDTAVTARPSPVRLTNSQQGQNSTQGKISLVPTNFLLKPPQPQIQLRPQQHILYAKPTVQNSAGLQTSAGGKMPMKVLLVNALQKNPSAVSTTTVTDSSIMSVSTANTVKHNGICPQTISSGNETFTVQEAPPHKSSSASTKGFRTLLNHLIKMQNESMELSRQRLALERERFEFEKMMAERIVNILSPAKAPIKEPEPETIIPLLVPKIEKEDD